MRFIRKFGNFIYESKKPQYEYQFRDIDVGVFLKRLVGEDIWSFTTEKDFEENSNKSNIVD